MSLPTNITLSQGLVPRERRVAALGQRGATLWLTGLSGAGKSTIAHALEAALIERGRTAYVLDGDNLRYGLNSDLGFSPEDRAENIRRVGEVARLFVDANLFAITAFISPYRADRARVRALHAPGDFIEIFVNCSIEECERRDTKGLYAKARRGEVAEFTGVSAPYEAPDHPELVLETARQDVTAGVTTVLDYLAAQKRLG